MMASVVVGAFRESERSERLVQTVAAAMLLGACVCAVFPLLTDAYVLIAASFLLGIGLGQGSRHQPRKVRSLSS